jgi:uncharacterized membrane-anchored protein
MDSRAHELPGDHPQRIDLANEVHARPPELITAPARATYVAVVVARQEHERETAHLARLCEQFGVPPLRDDANHFSAQLNGVRLKWERHAEFSGYTFFAASPGSLDFNDPATGFLPDGWLAAIPGQTIVAAHAVLAKYDAQSSYQPAIEQCFAQTAVVGAEIGDGAGLAFTDFRIREDGFERFLVFDRSLTPRQAGRMTQRLFEIEAYRVMALLALPIAREQGPRAAEVEQALAALTEQIAHNQGGGDESLLARLTQLAATIETAIDASQYRFSAGRAYYDLVRSRIQELREHSLPGIQTIDEFMQRRLAPAMATCASVSQRLRDLSERVAQASGLLSTRVEIVRERQNQALLASMEHRARIQLRLQETVEGLSVAAITYYGAGLVGYLARGAHAAGVGIDYEIAVALSIPIIALLVALALRRVRKKARGGPAQLVAPPSI